jgi:hypothetical protein
MPDISGLVQGAKNLAYKVEGEIDKIPSGEDVRNWIKGAAGGEKPSAEKPGDREKRLGFKAEEVPKHKISGGKTTAPKKTAQKKTTKRVATKR